MNQFWNRHIFLHLRNARTYIGRMVKCDHIRSYSQEGEDMILRRIFENRKEGFFVDVGAYHPTLYSNTCFFYRMGWRGINIEPNPEYIWMFQKYRNRDINLAVGVSDVETDLPYYMFNEPALNTVEEAIAKRPTRNKERVYPIGKTVINVRRLETILQEHLPENRKIDFLSVDVEGHEFQVILSNDWERFRPKCLLVEVLYSDLEEIIRSKLHRFMKEAGYTLHAKTANTLFYLDARSWER